MNEKQNAAKIPLKLTVAAVFAALVAVVTLSFVIGIPATGGYFNLGEAIIYIAALVLRSTTWALVQEARRRNSGYANSRCITVRPWGT